MSWIQCLIFDFSVYKFLNFVFEEMKKFLIIIFSFIPSLVFSAEKGLDKKIDEAFAPVSDFFSQLVFFVIF